MPQNKSPHPWSGMPTIETPAGNFMKFKKLYDGVSGTITEILLETDNQRLKRKEDQITLLVDHGYYHDGSAKEQLETGQTIICTFGYNPKSPISKKIRKLKLGQIAAFVYTEDIDTGQAQPFHNIEVYSDGTMNEDWLKENAPTGFEAAKKIFGANAK